MNHNLNQLHKFISPEIIFGVGCWHSVANYMETFGAHKVLLVSDPGVFAAGWAANIQANPEEQGIDYCLYTDVSSNPRVDEVMLGAEFYHSEGHNIVVTMGGDSSMDCAKGTGIVAAHGHDTFRFEGVDRLRVPNPPLILTSTTAGISADVSQFVIISNQNERTKFSVMSKVAVPDVSLIDPETMLTMDPFLSACTGIGALVHVTGAFVSIGRGPLTDPHALEAIRLIDGNLVQIIASLGDIALRKKIMLESMQARLAFSNAILGVVHAMSHSLGDYLDLLYGPCNMALVKHVVAFDYSATSKRFKVTAETFGIDYRGLTQGQVHQCLMDHLIAFKRAVDFHEGLTLYGVDSSDTSFLSHHTMQDPRIPTSPCESSQCDTEVVYGETL